MSYEINEIRGNLYEIQNKNNLSTQKIKELKENLPELEKSLSKLKKYYDIEYKRIRDVGNLFNLSIDEVNYKPIRTNSVFNKN